jgi:ribonuclease P protein component
MATDTEHTDSKLRGRPLRSRVWHTLPKRSDFLRLSASGLRRATPGFILQTAPHTDGALPLRVGFTASRKVGNAVARNRAKRRLRALCDKVMPEAAAHDHDYVLIGRTETLSRDFAAMERDLRHALKKIREGKVSGKKA